MMKKCYIRELDLSFNPIGNEGLYILCNCMEKDVFENLKKIDLTSCKIDFEGLYKLYFTLQQFKKLEYINMSKNNLYSKKFKELKHYISLAGVKELKISQCKIGNEGVQALAEALINNTSIKVLDIANNKFDDYGFIHFKEFPLKNNSLEIFNVSKNLITDDSAKEFIVNLNKNTSFKELNFFDNEIKNEAGNAMIEVLRTNRNILTVNLKFNRVQMRVNEEIKRLLKTNRENYKNKIVPNLKVAIRQNYVHPTDFEIIDTKIQETSMNSMNVNNIHIA